MRDRALVFAYWNDPVSATRPVYRAEAILRVDQARVDHVEQLEQNLTARTGRTVDREHFAKACIRVVVVDHEMLVPRRETRGFHSPRRSTSAASALRHVTCPVTDANHSLIGGHGVQQLIRGQKPVDALDLARDKRMDALSHGLQIQHESPPWNREHLHRRTRG